jgi:hypothetical protein
MGAPLTAGEHCEQVLVVLSAQGLYTLQNLGVNIQRASIRINPAVRAAAACAKQDSAMG